MRSAAEEEEEKVLQFLRCILLKLQAFVEKMPPLHGTVPSRPELPGEGGAGAGIAAAGAITAGTKTEAATGATPE